jgi:hypothetical protein
MAGRPARIRSRAVDTSLPEVAPPPAVLLNVASLKTGSNESLTGPHERATEGNVRGSAPGGCAAVPSGRPLSPARAINPGIPSSRRAPRSARSARYLHAVEDVGQAGEQSPLVCAECGRTPPDENPDDDWRTYYFGVGDGVTVCPECAAALDPSAKAD